MTTTMKPFLKWVGGKSQLLTTISEKIPPVMENYHEPFVGGGSVLFTILSLQKENKITIRGKVYAYDSNKNLIATYKAIQSYPNEFHKELTKIVEIYDSLRGTTIIRNPTVDQSNTSKESYYYWIRHCYNKEQNQESIENCARFVFLNKTCFRGMYRVGPNGMNVPYGHYKKTPGFLSKEECLAIQDLIKQVVFTKSDFSESIEKAQKQDFIYLDPPYAPENPKSFVKYTEDGFSKEQHEKLFTQTVSLREKKVAFLMSNAKVEIIEEYFKDFQSVVVNAKRAIHCKNPGSMTQELLIYYYPLEQELKEEEE
jgi:DNA adenine methylase